MEPDIKTFVMDFFIIGGGTAGCYAALALCEESGGRVLTAEKANIRHNGCPAAGVNATNAYIVPGKTPQGYVDYIRTGAGGTVRGDLLPTMTEGLSRTAAKLESLGLIILKNARGQYVARGNRNVEINGENIKPILADVVAKQSQIAVLNQVDVSDYIMKDGRILGAYAIGVDEPVLYVISAEAVLCAIGGAAGLCRFNHLGFSRYKMWYPSFNTGAGYAVGIRAGVEMTTFEMRFITLRCKDTIVLTGTLAQGAGAKQISSLGEVYEQKYGITTSQWVHGTATENLEGRGPCYLRTVSITREQDEELQRAYLNMAPSQTLRWMESGYPPSVQNAETEGTEPYTVGGHTASGYWADTHRRTTIKGLFATGDVAGGYPQKYMTGAFVEGEIAARAVAKYQQDTILLPVLGVVRVKQRWLEGFLNRPGALHSTDELEEAMQAAVDEYVGEISAYCRFSDQFLRITDGQIRGLQWQAELLSTPGPQELVYILELLERFALCRSVIVHLGARKETRWYSFAEHTDYPRSSAEWNCYVNSKLENSGLNTLFRPFVKEGETYKHRDHSGKVYRLWAVLQRLFRQPDPLGCRQKGGHSVS